MDILILIKNNPCHAVPVCCWSHWSWVKTTSRVGLISNTRIFEKNEFLGETLKYRKYAMFVSFKILSTAIR